MKLIIDIVLKEKLKSNMI